MACSEFHVKGDSPFTWNSLHIRILKTMDNVVDNNKIDLQEIDWWGMDWIDLAQDRVKW